MTMMLMLPSGRRFVLSAATRCNNLAASAAVRSSSLHSSSHVVPSLSVARQKLCTKQQQQQRPVGAAGRTTKTTSRYFSEAAAEKPFIPGVGKGKTSTGYVGLPVEPDWYNLIHQHFQALLDKMEASDMPETAQYRIDVTKWCHYVMATAKAHPDDPEAVEDAVNMGQVEELIDMAKDEMIALDTYLSVRMWELVEQANPAVDFNPDPMQDPFGEGGDANVADQVKKGMEGMKKDK